MRGVVGARGRSLDALDDGHRSARDREMPQIERHGEHDAAERVDEVPGRHIPGVAAAGDECFAFGCLQRLHDDLRFVPAVGRRGRRDGEQHPVAPGSTCGLAATSPLLTLAITAGWPPFADTRRMPLLPCPNTIPLASQVIPRNGASAGQIVTAAPPLTAIFLIARSTV